MSIKSVLISYKNHLLKIAGYICVALGVTGILLPGVPTTVFFILALACFNQASSQLAARLTAHPRYGAALQQWQQCKAIPRQAKQWATLSMVLSYLLLLALSPAIWLLCSVGTIKMAVISYILSRPSAATG